MMKTQARAIFDFLSLIFKILFYVTFIHSLRKKNQIADYETSVKIYFTKVCLEAENVVSLIFCA